MSDDLVKRLRDVAGVIIGAQSQNLEEDYGLAREAADRITDLHFQISVIQGAAAHAKRSYEEHLAVYRQKLEEKPPIWHDDIQSLQERDAIMTDRIEKLEAALREIKDLSDRRSVHPMSSEADYFRIARKALEGKDD